MIMTSYLVLLISVCNILGGAWGALEGNLNLLGEIEINHMLPFTLAFRQAQAKI